MFVSNQHHLRKASRHVEPTIWSVMRINERGTHILISPSRLRRIRLRAWRRSRRRRITMRLRWRDSTWGRRIFRRIIRHRRWIVRCGSGRRREAAGVRKVVVGRSGGSPGRRRRRHVRSRIVRFFVGIMLSGALISCSDVSMAPWQDTKGL
jgi:hypothetical protein